MHATWIAIILVAGSTILVAGCATPEPPAPTMFAVGGTLDRNATSEDVEDLRGRVQAHNGTLAIMESYPLQYRASGLMETECEALKLELASLAYVAVVGTCEATESPAGEP